MILWGNVVKAIEHYRKRGYSYLEVPWIVSQEAIQVTIPSGKEPLVCQYGSLVGSAEQSFIQLMMDGECPTGKFMAATPCFRDDEVDLLHQKTFFKVELIEVQNSGFDGATWTEEALGHMVKDALDCYQSLINGAKAYVAVTAQGLDIKLKGIELGSYGIRRYENWVWVYGTGYADPRYNTACLSSIPGLL